MISNLKVFLLELSPVQFFNYRPSFRQQYYISKFQTTTHVWPKVLLVSSL